MPTPGKIKRLCLTGLKTKEDGDSILVEGLVATTHPDRDHDILSEGALNQIVTYINDTDTAGGSSGAYRSVSLFHDWIHENDPTLDEAAFLKPTAEIVEMDAGHKGVKVSAEINKFYKGDMTPEEIKYRIDNNQIAGFSIEYETDDSHSKDIKYQGDSYRFIDELTEFGGVGFARARMIANPKAVIYKEIVNKIKEGEKMVEEKVKPPEVPETEEVKDEPKEEEEKKEEPKVEEKEINTDKILKEFKEIKEVIRESITVKPKVLKTKEGDIKMDEKESKIPLSVKEMNKALEKGDTLSFKEATRMYFKENPQVVDQLRTTGIPLRHNLRIDVKESTWERGLGCGKLAIVNRFETKDTLDTTTNTTTYTQSIVEFADLYLPTIIETFNNQTNLFGALPKREHLMGGNQYGWRTKTDQASDLSVDPDVTTVVKDPVDKLKLRLDIKEYRVGVSVTDYVIYHGRATIGDILMLEVQARMRDMMRDINNDLFTEQVGGSSDTKVLGLAAVADSAGNTTLFGLTRSTANRLSPASARTTYSVMLGGIVLASLRSAARFPEVEGSMRGNLRYIMNPQGRDAVFNLEDTNIRYQNEPNLGFFGAPAYDGIPIIVDSSCSATHYYCVDFESEYVVISRAPQMTGLARVGAAQEAFINVYLAHVYEQPRRICQLVET